MIDGISTRAVQPSERVLSGMIHRWPTWLAIGVTVVVAFDLSEGVDLANAVAASALIYLGAAVLRRPVAAWAVAVAVIALIVATEVLEPDVDPTWVLLILAVPVVLYGLWSDAPREQWLRHQVIAMVGFGAAAAVALGVTKDVGGYLVAAGLLGHAIWDVVHYRADKVVARSYAETCLVLDALLAVVVVIATATN